MAILYFLNGEKKTVSPEQGAMAWMVLTGEKDPSPEQEKFVSRIADITLNWRNAPDSYIQKYEKMIMEFAVGEWMVNMQGHPTKPEDDFGWTFAKKWGLWDNLGMTDKARRAAR